MLILLSTIKSMSRLCHEEDPEPPCLRMMKTWDDYGGKRNSCMDLLNYYRLKLKLQCPLASLLIDCN